MHIKKGDTVYVNAGNDKGKTGKVLSVIPEKDRVVVEGVNMVSKHTKPNAKYPQGGIVKQEAGIHVSNVNLVVDGKPTRVGYKFVTVSLSRSRIFAAIQFDKIYSFVSNIRFVHASVSTYSR
ncbi:MAG: 50S ribosomal protein L24, partial [Fibrobacter sp.]|nr:50S ribosomal protein L24 [Fibrobacter sp.]